jgi:hypothetical protein
MFNQPEGHLGEQKNSYNPHNALFYNEEFFHSLYSDAVDKAWEVFRYFVHVHMWDGFVYLFLLVWYCEPDDSLFDNELMLIEGHLSNLHNSGASSKDKSVATDEIIKQFKEFRNTKNETLRNEVMDKVFYQLSFQSIYEQHLTHLIPLLNSMSFLQKQALRHIFISRIYGYSKFAEYLLREWNNKPTDEMKENDQILIKENPTQIIETGLKQMLNLGNQNENTYATNFKKDIIDKLESSQNEKTYADAVKFKKNISDKLEETINNSLINKVSNKNSEFVNPIPNSSKFVKMEEGPVSRKMEITENIEFKNKGQQSEFVDDENSIEKKDVKNEIVNKDYEEEIFTISANVTSEIISKENVMNDRRSKESSQHDDNSQPKDLQNSINVEKLQQEIKMLRQEAAKHQAALGGIMNVGWRDNDSNNSMQLTKDIEKLQKDLSNFTRVKRGGIVINYDAVRALLQNHKCKAQVENKTNAKLILSAALQQKIIRYTLKHTDDYFKQTLNELPDKVDFIPDDKLEAAIFCKTNQLIELTERFTEVNTGTDVHTQLLPIKIRQHIYAALGQRSFIDSNHPLIKYLVDMILSGMNEYRTIDDEEKNKKINTEADTIIRQILHLFYFRLHTQEPKPSIKFYESGDEFDPGVMEIVGQIKKDDDEEEELEVEICSFPAVALLKYSDEERRVFTKAQVIVRPKKSV